MTPEELAMIERLDALTEEAQKTADGVAVFVSFQSLPVDVFNAYAAENEDAEIVVKKCACGSCGKLVLGFIVQPDPDVRAFVEYVREATEEETIVLLEDMVYGS